MDNANLFFYEKCILTAKGTKTEHTLGCPTVNAMKSNFKKLCKWLEMELFTESELHAKMCSFTEKDLNVYTLQWIENQLQQHYQNSIFFTDEAGPSNVVCFTDMASTI